MSQACLVVHPELPNADVAILEMGGKKIIVKATKDIAKGDLTVAMGISKHTHMMITPHARSPSGPWRSVLAHAVSCNVSWPVSAEEQAVGIEDGAHQYQIWVQPELKLPKPTLGKGAEMQWSSKESCYPSGQSPGNNT